MSGTKRNGIILIVSGPSGAGKTTVCNAVRQQLGNLHFSVSCTTRQPRTGEVDGQDYHFISIDEFEDRIRNDEFVEHALVYGNYYGTLRSEVLEKARQGHDILLDIDVQGAMQIRENALKDDLLASCIELVFVGPPSLVALEQRLRGRKTDAEDVIERRLKTARSEMEYWDKYDYLLINHEIDQVVADMVHLVESLRKSTKRLEDSGFGI